MFITLAFRTKVAKMAPSHRLIMWLSCLVFCLSLADGANFSCSSVKASYISKGLPENDVPVQAILGSDLKVCPASSSGCCTKQMEVSFVGLSRTHFEIALKARTNNLKITFADNGKTFDAFFRELIKNSEKDLNKMFIKTYGQFYQQHSKVFTDLFLDLNKYYNGESLDLAQVMNNFFSSLMRQMFQLMNANYVFTESYLDCVTKYMDDLKPFGEAKQTLSVQLKRAFVSARTFVQALNVGLSVVKQLQGLSASKECENELTKMMYCSWCKGKTAVLPCSALCTDSYKNCLMDLKDLNIPWDNYISTLHEVIHQLEGPFSIENVIVPIGVKISFAIMKNQETNEVVSKKIFDGCGTPKGKSKRSTDDFFIEGSERMKRNSDYSKDSGDALPTSAAGTNLRRLTKEFTTQISGSKGFWTRLPTSICTAQSVGNDPNKCWNGTAIGRYTSSGDNNIGSPLSTSSSIVQQQISQLKTITQRLKSALAGEDVNVVGEGEGSGEESGSGSGSGNTIDEEEPTVSPTTSDNTVDRDENMKGGGVGGDGGNTLGKRVKNGSVKTTVSFNGLLAAVLLCILLSIWW